MSRRDMSYTAALAVVTIIFFTWGGLTSLNDVLIPHLKAVFQMNYAQSMLIQSTFFGAYFLMSLPASKVVAKFGYKNSIVIGLIVAAIGAAMFFPAARIPSYPLFLGALFVLASGITLLQVSANPYISLLGDPAGAPSRLNLAQALNSLGTTVFPYVIGPLILSGTVLTLDELAAKPVAEQIAYRAHEAASVQMPYMIIAGCLLLLAVFVYTMRIPSLVEATESADPVHHSFTEVLSQKHLFFGVIAIFVYVGAEVSIGSFLINYISAPEIGNLDHAIASKYLAYYWGGAMVGRFIGAALLRVADARKLLALFAVAVIALLAVTMSTKGSIAMYAVLSIGLFNSIMFPTIFTIAIERLGPMTSKASSLLIMGIVGGAVIPLAQGALSDVIGVQHSFVIPLVCYVFIVWYGLSGSRIRAGQGQHTSTQASGVMH
ncbi:sugar MFS transporter [Lysobacter gummosus]|jgi:FHS family L-fucose permease-like MFS transporter|uniref:Sugar MFS transporter n=1 Tax=Lysobacter gummosus TaxID=262324 RepID=A0ABY3XBG2_9GAMM|nr:sugar MFS transporter [Lysobacter gummosus]ALN93851.1 glucose/galactose transporter WARNING family protein [Lysobacter gummosus]UNP29305.1 sugar MFS transporter [Lysobacter gummosus]